MQHISAREAAAISELLGAYRGNGIGGGYRSGGIGGGYRGRGGGRITDVVKRAFGGNWMKDPSAKPAKVVSALVGTSEVDPVSRFVAYVLIAGYKGYNKLDPCLYKSEPNKDAYKAYLGTLPESYGSKARSARGAARFDARILYSFLLLAAAHAFVVRRLPKSREAEAAPLLEAAKELCSSGSTFSAAEAFDVLRSSKPLVEAARRSRAARDEFDDMDAMFQCINMHIVEPMGVDCHPNINFEPRVAVYLLRNAHTTMYERAKKPYLPHYRPYDSDQCKQKMPYVRTPFVHQRRESYDAEVADLTDRINTLVAQEVAANAAAQQMQPMRSSSRSSGSPKSSSVRSFEESPRSTRRRSGTPSPRARRRSGTPSPRARRAGAMPSNDNGMLRNPETGRMVSADGRIGRRVRQAWGV